MCVTRLHGGAARHALGRRCGGAPRGSGARLLRENGGGEATLETLAAPVRFNASPAPSAADTLRCDRDGVAGPHGPAPQPRRVVPPPLPALTTTHHCRLHAPPLRAAPPPTLTERTLTERTTRDPPRSSAGTAEARRLKFQAEGRRALAHRPPRPPRPPPPTLTPPPPHDDTPRTCAAHCRQPPTSHYPPASHSSLTTQRARTKREAARRRWRPPRARARTAAPRV